MSGGPTAQPSRIPGNIVFDVVPAWTTTSGARLQRLGKRVGREAELAVGDVLDDQEPVPARELDQRGAPVAGETHTRRVLVVGDAVDELRAQAPASSRSSSSTSSPCSSSGTATSFASKLRNAWIAPRYVGAFDDHDVAGVEIRLADQLERLDPAARDQQLVVGRTAALQPLEPVCERVARPGQPACRRVLERTHLAFGGELLEQRRDALARERLRVGEAAREGDQVGDPEQRQNRGDPLADIAARSCRGERVPPSRLGRHRPRTPILCRLSISGDPRSSHR